MAPELLQAPRYLSLHGIGLPKGLSSLSSTTALSTLSLTRIPESCYFPPAHLVTQLHGLPCLEELSIGFALPIPLPSSGGELSSAPISPVTLPILRQFTFQGEDVYLDNVVAQINTPLLKLLNVTLLFDLAFTLVNLTGFIRRTERLGCHGLVAGVMFNKDGPTIHASCHEQPGIMELSLRVNCKPFDWQINSAAQVCSALGEVLSAVEKLALDLDVDRMPTNWERRRDSMIWHELLLPYLGVKKLYIGPSLTLELSQSLDSVAGELVLDLLPELEELEVQLEMGHSKMYFPCSSKLGNPWPAPYICRFHLRSKLSSPMNYPPCQRINSKVASCRLLDPRALGSVNVTLLLMTDESTSGLWIEQCSCDTGLN